MGCTVAAVFDPYAWGRWEQGRGYMRGRKVWSAQLVSDLMRAIGRERTERERKVAADDVVVAAGCIVETQGSLSAQSILSPIEINVREKIKMAVTPNNMIRNVIFSKPICSFFPLV